MQLVRNGSSFILRLEQKMSADALKILDEIEAEMRRIGYWSDSPALSAAIRDGHFKSVMDAPSIGLWLQGLFLPNARAAAREGSLPAYSQAGEIARRQYSCDVDMPGTHKLLDLIHEFDELCLKASSAKKV